MDVSQQIAGRKVFGPYDIQQAVSGDCLQLTEIPYANVQGGQLLISVADNYNIQDQVTVFPRFWATAEVQIWGRIQGYDEILKTQQVRMVSGPMVYIVPFEEAYDYIDIRARNMSGGRRGPVFPDVAPNPTAERGFKLDVTIHFTPRGGMGEQAAQAHFARDTRGVG